MVNDDVIRGLLRQSVQGLELEPTMVLADALLETDRPDLGEDLALILSDRIPFPRDQRGRAARRHDRERTLNVVFRRIHRRFAWSPYDVEEKRRGLRELKEIERNWGTMTERSDDIARTIDWLEDDVGIVDQGTTLYERATWLLNGTFGRGAQILAEEIVDGSPRNSQDVHAFDDLVPPSGANRVWQMLTPSAKQRATASIRDASQEAQLFRLVLAFDDLLPPSGANRVWQELTAPAKERATASIRDVMRENGAEIGESPVPGRRRRTRR